MENNNFEIEKEQEGKKTNKKILYLIIGIFAFLVAILGGTYAYYAFNATNDNITGTAGSVNLVLNVTKVLPETEGTDDILITNFNEIATALNEECYDGVEFALCQLYKINILNNSEGVNVTLQGKVSFNNTTAPNLSWLLIDNYSASTNYTQATLPTTFNTATSTLTNFVSNVLVNSKESKDFYMLVWVNESEEEQTDEGSYTGTIRFEDANGKGVTSTFEN